jgi:serine/threonine protein phosphatase 1
MIAVIGDIHGCHYTLSELVLRIKTRYPDIPLYCVGDIIDRGNFSCETFELIKSQNIKFTAGNHDYMFYYFMRDPENEIGRSWLYNGYETTMVSYNNRLEKMNEHLDLIETAPLFINLEDCFISHAGISVYYQSILPPDITKNIKLLEETITADLASDHGILWTRDELADLGKLQIVGHTRQLDVQHLKKNNVAYIDTSVYTGNKLSAVIVDQGKISDVIAVHTYKEDLE